MALRRFGVSLEDDLLKSLDRFVRENGFSNRSQAIRFLVEKSIAEEKWQCNHTVAGTVIILYDHSRKDIAARIDEIQNDYRDIMLCSSRYYIANGYCLHIATVTGVAARLTEMSDKLIAIKGIRHGKLSMSRAE